MNKEEFINELTKINVVLTEEQITKLEKYYQLLKSWNEKINLTRIILEHDVYLKHFYDSLTIIKGIKLNNQNLCDMGTGAGFPGIVLKICFPNLKVTLLESINKKCLFLNEVIKELNLKDIVVVNERIEDYGRKNREKFDIVTARALATLNTLFEYSAPLLKVEGYFIAMKADIDCEIKETSNALKELYLSVENIVSFELPFNGGKRNLVIVKKDRPTLLKYPRKFSEIKRKSL